jgi:DNA-binding transcriptional regulator YbjK
VAAARTEALRPIAEVWMRGLPEIREPHFGASADRDISALLDGIILLALVTETGLDEPGLMAAIRRLTAS